MLNFQGLPTSFTNFSSSSRSPKSLKQVTALSGILTTIEAMYAYQKEQGLTFFDHFVSLDVGWFWCLFDECFHVTDRSRDVGGKNLLPVVGRIQPRFLVLNNIFDKR